MARSTKFKRATLGVVAVCVGLGAAAGYIFSKRKNVPPLPALASYTELPTEFNLALQAEYARIRSGGNNTEGVRKLAHLYQANRLYSKARLCYQFIKAAAPSGLNAQDHYYLADMAQNEGDLAHAQTELRAVLETEPRYLPAHMALAETLFKSGQEEEAAKRYAVVLSIEADHPQASVGFARVELQRGQDDAAVSRLEKLMAAHPEATSGAALLAQLFGRRGETERAAAMTQWSQQKREPAMADPWMDALLSDCYDGQRLSLKFEEYLFAGQMDQALAFLDRVEALDPKSWTPQMLRGWSQARGGHHAAAVIEFRKALAKSGDPEKICPLLVASLLALPDLPQAEAIMADYYARLPDSVPILIAYSDVALRQENKELAEVLLRKILEKEPYLYTPNMSLAKILWSDGDRVEAVKCLQRVAEVFPVDVASRGLLGQYYLEKSDPLSALAPLEQARVQTAAGTPAEKRLTEMLVVAYLQAGGVEAAKENVPETTRYYEKAVQLAPENPEAFAAIANTWVQLKQFHRAALALNKLSALQPENPTIQLSLGDVLYQEGAAGPARVHWQRALQLAAINDGELRQALDARLKGDITPETFK